MTPQTGNVTNLQAMNPGRLAIGSAVGNRLAVAQIARGRSSANTPDKFAEYRDDPVRFGIEVLGERFPPDIVRVMESVETIPKQGLLLARIWSAASKDSRPSPETDMSYL